MQDTALLISILVFAVIVILGSGLFYILSYRKSQQRLVGKIKNSSVEQTTEEQSKANSNNADNKSFIASHIVEPMGKALKPSSDDEITYLRKNLVMAGYRKRNTFNIYYGAKAFIGMLLPLCVFLFKIIVIKNLPSADFIVLIIVSALIGFYLPNLWLKIKVRTRQRKILEGFPDALDLIIVCVEAGMGLDAAIARTSKEIRLSSKEVSDEFNLVSLELRAGKLRQDALRNLAKRIGLEEVNTLISLLIQTDKFGTSVAQALRVHSESMRDKRYQRADEIAAKLPVKLVFPLILFIFPCIFVVLVGPAAITIIRNLFPALGG